MKTTPTRASGFTLVELMIVVAIIGILSSVALPTFKTFSLRTKQSERRLVMKVVKQSAEDIYVRYNRIEDGQGNWLPFLFGAPNPAGVATPTKRPYNPAAAGWNYLGVTDQFLEGSLYYTYTWWTIDAPGAQFLIQRAEGDLDGDGQLSFVQHQYQLMESVYQLTWEWPISATIGLGVFAPDRSLAGNLTW